jgi:uncharacterized protein (DUF486 family)
MRPLYTVGLLVLSNLFMTFAWYGHLKFKDIKLLENSGLLTAIVISWGLAFFEYCLQVPANRIGFSDNGGPFSLVQLKVIQEIISLIVFAVFASIVFNAELKWNHLAGFMCLVLAVYFVFKDQ